MQSLGKPKTTKKPVAKKTTATKAKPAPKAAQFGFGGGMNPFAPAKKGGKTTNFANAMESMNNLLSDLELVDTKDSKELLSDADKKSKLLN